MERYDNTDRLSAVLFERELMARETMKQEAMITMTVLIEKELMTVEIMGHELMTMKSRQKEFTKNRQMGRTKMGTDE